MKKKKGRKKHSRIFVTLYSHTRAFGGHEEGGWYYSVYEVEAVWRASSMVGAQIIENKLVSHYGQGYIIQIEHRKDLKSLQNCYDPKPTYC